MYRIYSGGETKNVLVLQRFFVRELILKGALGRPSYAFHSGNKLYIVGTLFHTVSDFLSTFLWRNTTRKFPKKSTLHR